MRIAIVSREARSFNGSLHIKVTAADLDYVTEMMQLDSHFEFHSEGKKQTLRDGHIYQTHINIHQVFTS